MGASFSVSAASLFKNPPILTYESCLILSLIPACAEAIQLLHISALSELIECLACLIIVKSNELAATLTQTKQSSFFRLLSDKNVLIDLKGCISYMETKLWKEYLFCAELLCLKITFYNWFKVRKLCCLLTSVYRVKVEMVCRWMS